MSRSDMDNFHLFQALPPSRFGEPSTVVAMAASARRRGGRGRWPIGATRAAGRAALGTLVLLGIIHSAKGKIVNEKIRCIFPYFLCFEKDQLSKRLEAHAKLVSPLTQCYDQVNKTYINLT